MIAGREGRGWGIKDLRCGMRGCREFAEALVGVWSDYVSYAMNYEAKSKSVSTTRQTLRYRLDMSIGAG